MRLARAKSRLDGRAHNPLVLGSNPGGPTKNFRTVTPRCGGAVFFFRRIVCQTSGGLESVIARHLRSSAGISNHMTTSACMPRQIRRRSTLGRTRRAPRIATDGAPALGAARTSVANSGRAPALSGHGAGAVERTCKLPNDFRARWHQRSLALLLRMSSIDNTGTEPSFPSTISNASGGYR